jgi:hypothetical protein
VEDENADRVYVPGTTPTPPARDVEPFWPPEELDPPVHGGRPVPHDAPPPLPVPRPRRPGSRRPSAVPPRASRRSRPGPTSRRDCRPTQRRLSRCRRCSRFPPHPTRSPTMGRPRRTRRGHSRRSARCRHLRTWTSRRWAPGGAGRRRRPSPSPLQRQRRRQCRCRTRRSRLSGPIPTRPWRLGRTATARTAAEVSTGPSPARETRRPLRRPRQHRHPSPARIRSSALRLRLLRRPGRTRGAGRTRRRSIHVPCSPIHM